MPEYIDREALMYAIEKSCRDNPHRDPNVRRIHDHEHRHFLGLVENQPTADVVEVRHGEWIPNEYFKGHYYCSKCTSHIEDTSENPSINFPYCHCGAIMDGKGD